MSRLPRLRLPDFPLHVVVRGNNRQPIFVSDGDRIVFHTTLVASARRFGMQVHAYVFMPNHVHLLVTGRSAESVSKAMQSLGRRYVGYFNFLHRRTGTLWEGRYYSSVIDADRYFLACQRYIEMNPQSRAMPTADGIHMVELSVLLGECGGRSAHSAFDPPAIPTRGGV